MKKTKAETALPPLRKRLAQLVGITDPGEAGLRFLAMVMVAWADGRVLAGELEAIRREAARAELSPKVRAQVEAFLAAPPGPYFEHRVITMLRLAARELPPAAVQALAQDLKRCVQAVDHTRFPYLRRLFDGLSPTTQGVEHVREALAEPLPADVEGVLARVVLGDARAAKGPRVAPQQLTAMHPESETFTQARALVFPAEGGAAAATIACIESFAFGSDLPEEAVRAVFTDLAARPEIERWAELYALVGSLAPAPTAQVVEGLTTQLGPHVKGALHLVSMRQMSDLEDQLARHHGWVGWMEGSYPELLVDAEEVRRDVPPGNFACPRSALLPPRIVRQRISHVSGLIFRVLELESDIGERLALAAPQPEPGAPPTADFIRWLCHFLPLIQDPLSTPLFGYDPGAARAEVLPSWIPPTPAGEEHPAPTARESIWKMDLRSGFPDDPSDLPPDPLPAGTALVVTPWVWLRLAWALGVDPDL